MGFLFNVWDSLDRNEVSRIVSEAAGKAFPNDPPRFVERAPSAISISIGSAARSSRRLENVEIDVVEKVSTAPRRGNRDWTLPGLAASRRDRGSRSGSPR